MRLDGAVFVVAAGEVTDVPAVQLPDALGKFLHEIAVMRDEDQRALVFLQRVLHPLARGDVQMVRRLVEDEQVDPFVHQHTKPQPRLLAAGERRDGLEHVLALEQKRSQPVARGLHGAAFLIQHRIEQRPLRVLKVDDLRQVRPLDRRSEFDLASARLFAQQHAQKRRFARAVVAQQRDALAALHQKIDALKQHAPVVALAETLDAQHLVAEKVPLRELRAHGLVLMGLFRLLDAVHAVLDGHRAAIERAVVDAPALHALERKAELGELCLLLFILPELKGKARLLFLHIKRIISAVKLRLAVRQLHDARHDAI